MNARPRLLLLLAALAGSAHPVFSQGGSLTPPVGIPGPTMKPLNLVEPRIPLVAGAPGVTVEASGQITISQSGSYYLTGNVTIASSAKGIQISASGVTLDLMGYSVVYNGAGTSQQGVLVLGSNVTIENGHIVSTTVHDGSSFVPGGFDFGVYAYDRSNVTVRNLSVRGVSNSGITIFGDQTVSCLVEDCTVTTAGNTGIANRGGIVKNSAVNLCGGPGIDARSVLGCRVTAAVGNGISAHAVESCSAASTGATSAHGISAVRVANSLGTSAGFSGIVAEIVCNSRGETSGANGLTSAGISATVVSGSIGIASNPGGGSGISATQCVSQSYGESATTNTSIHAIYCAYGPVTASRGVATAGGCGIYARTVGSSSGDSYGTGSSSHGIYGADRVDNSSGRAIGVGSGIFASLVNSSYGFAAAGAKHGIEASGLVTHSIGYRFTDEVGASKYGLITNMAVGCYSINGLFANFKSDMP